MTGKKRRRLLMPGTNFPAAPTPAFKIGEKVDDPLQMYLSDIFTISANLAGICGISVPCGFTGDGLPIGLMIYGRPFREDMVLRIGQAYQEATDWLSPLDVRVFQEEPPLSEYSSRKKSPEASSPVSR